MIGFISYWVSNKMHTKLLGNGAADHDVPVKNKESFINELSYNYSIAS